jgi:hypothetical protein
MPSSRPVSNMVAALSDRLFPTVVTWNQLEGRPRTQSFERALTAEIRDPLWMLSKQWQMGEFEGSDTGSPVFAKLLMQKTRLTKYQPASGQPELFDLSIPLETKVERRPVPMVRQKRILALNIRLVMARQWFSLISDITDYRSAYIKAYPILKPDPTKKQDFESCAHPEVWDTFEALAGRAMDGGGLYGHLIANPANHAYDGVVGILPADHGAIDLRATKFLAWAARFLEQPPAQGDNAWIPERLEYQFATSAPMPDGTEKVYVADEYYSGSLDWYSLDEDAGTAALAAVAGSNVTGLLPDAPFTTIPIPVSFSGMANTRWWTFEDHQTNFGDIDASTTDLAKLLFMEFALVYANDWFVIPQTLPSGSLAKVQGLAVTNVFGERLWIEAAGQGIDKDWSRWSMFTINVRNAAAGSAAADTTLLLLPTLAKAQASPPLEEVLLVRDEVANMVWGVEKTVPLATGISRLGNEVQVQTVNYLEGLLGLGGPPPLPPPMTAAVRYQVMNTVPENWIPFLPVHVPGSNRDIQLQRAAMPRILIGNPDPPEKIQPLTALLRQGLDDAVPSVYFVHEEEVPRAGVRVTQYYSRTRWTTGQVFTWLRAQKQTGRGEASSGLGFDRLVDQNSNEV